MSRRRGEFEHRTSIFEGAYRAWSHLGGLDPEDVETKPASELDPLTHPILNDPRLSGSKSSASNLDGTPRHEYPYEPLPRSGLQHPYVQAILSPWLGPDADAEAIQLGLTTLRTWWQHRRKGESGSAIAALGTEKMKGVVEGYTRHFFTLAHCVVVNDKAHPPRGLHQKMKEMEKAKRKRTKEESKTQDPIISLTAGEIRSDLTDPNLTPLEKLHAAQRRQLECAAGGGKDLSYGMNSGTSNPNFRVDMISKCLPGSIDLPSVVDVVSRQATQLAHHGMSSRILPVETLSSSNPAPTPSHQYGDPNTTPVVFVSSNGDIQIAMTVDGITCAHCVKIVETVLRGCNGNKSPISGLLDAAADRDLSSVLIRIDKASNAKRIAFEAARNLAMVGYTAIPKEMSIVGAGADSKAIADLGQLSTAFEVVANTELQDVFDWSSSCTCPDNGVLRGECARFVTMLLKTLFKLLQLTFASFLDVLVTHK
jgi:copper chaperone CopZ